MTGEIEPWQMGWQEVEIPIETSIALYRQHEHGLTWEERLRRAEEYIGLLYDEFAPEVSELDRSAGIQIGATGLAGLETRFGTSELAPRVYGGSYETGVLATYHHAGHSREFIRDMFRYAAKVNELHPGTYDAGAFVRFPVIGAYHDAIMGYGRGEDERLSAELAAEMMVTLGVTLLPDELTKAAIIGTTWNPTSNTQSVEEEHMFAAYQRAAAVADLMPIFDRRGPYRAVCLFVEDMCKRMHGQIFTIAATAGRFDYDDVPIDDCVQFIDDTPELQAKFGELLANQVGFFRNFSPADPMLDTMFPGRIDNAVFVQCLSDAYNQGRISAYQVLRVSRDFMYSEEPMH